MAFSFYLCNCCLLLADYAFFSLCKTDAIGRLTQVFLFGINRAVCVERLDVVRKQPPQSHPGATVHGRRSGGVLKGFHDALELGTTIHDKEETRVGCTPAAPCFTSLFTQHHSRAPLPPKPDYLQTLSYPNESSGPVEPVSTPQ